MKIEGREVFFSREERYLVNAQNSRLRNLCLTLYIGGLMWRLGISWIERGKDWRQGSQIGSYYIG